MNEMNGCAVVTSLIKRFSILSDKYYQINILFFNSIDLYVNF